MKKKSFVSLSFGLPLVVLLISLVSFKNDKNKTREFYQLILYHFQNDIQEKILDNYLQNALIPALHRMKLEKIGVFKPISNDTAIDKKIYVLIPFESLEMTTKIQAKLASDKAYQTSGSEYINAVYSSPPYTRMETILLQAFALAPKIQSPVLQSAKHERVYELRSYEGATEKIFKNKVQMFNEGDEIGLFKRLNFNAVFYGEVLAGSKMPNLMYMTCFENMNDRNDHWKTFSADSAWKKLSALPEYQKNVSHIDIILTHPAAYSDY